MRSRSILLSALLAAAVTASFPHSASADPAVDSLEHALPHGWSLLATDRELVIRHDHAVYAANPRASDTPPTHDEDEGPLVNLELRFNVEPRWSPAQLAAARATNVKLAADLAATRGRLKIDTLQVVHGAPHATTTDERTRLAAYQQAELVAHGKQVTLPTCALGGLSVFDSPATYAALTHFVDPPRAMTEAHAIADLVKQRCVAQ